VKERRYVTLTEREASMVLSEGIFDSLGRHSARSAELFDLWFERETSSWSNDLARCIYVAPPRRRRR
jgi:hypothetical protein